MIEEFWLGLKFFNLGFVFYILDNFLLVFLIRKFKNVDKSEGNVLFFGFFGNYIWCYIFSLCIEYFVE